MVSLILKPHKASLSLKHLAGLALRRPELLLRHSPEALVVSLILKPHKVSLSLKQLWSQGLCRPELLLHHRPKTLVVSLILKPHKVLPSLKQLWGQGLCRPELLLHHSLTALVVSPTLKPHKASLPLKQLWDQDHRSQAEVLSFQVILKQPSPPEHSPLEQVQVRNHRQVYGLVGLLRWFRLHLSKVTLNMGFPGLAGRNPVSIHLLQQGEHRLTALFLGSLGQVQQQLAQLGRSKHLEPLAHLQSIPVLPLLVPGLVNQTLKPSFLARRPVHRELKQVPQQLQPVCPDRSILLPEL